MNYSPPAALIKFLKPYDREVRDLARKDYNRIPEILSEGVARGRREGAFLHRDRIHHELKARRSARLTALTSGGAIPCCAGRS